VYEQLRESTVLSAHGMRMNIGPCILSDAEPRMALVGSYPVELHLKKPLLLLTVHQTLFR
jgi:hypothetical protein